MKTKYRKCKGTGKAIGHGCGVLNERRTYGLGYDCKCYQNWLFNSNTGKDLIKSRTIRAKKKEAKENKKRLNEKKQQTRFELRTTSYYLGQLQTQVNLIARLIDQHMGCISCRHGHGEPFTRKADGSHRWAAGDYKGIRFNLHNIHKSCSQCNTFKGGNPKGYDEGLNLRYGADYAMQVYTLHVPGKKDQPSYMKIDVYEMYKRSRKVVKMIEKGEISIEDAISARDKANKLITT